jgi:uncharacterized protein (TIGR02186 family)
MTRLLLVLFLALVAPTEGFAVSLISTLSEDDVEITSSFTGEQIVVFGAIRGAPEEGDPGYEVAVVVQGPSQDIVVRRKERLLGIWVNRSSREFKDVPSFYVMHLSDNTGAVLKSADLSQYRLGIMNLPFVQEATNARTRSFATALVDLRKGLGLYVEKQNAVTFLAPNVFRTTFFLPSVIPTGEYQVSVYLFHGQAILAGRTEMLKIEKGGFSEQIARAANAEPVGYGLVAVALAVFTGWFAGMIFRRP